MKKESQLFNPPDSFFPVNEAPLRGASSFKNSFGRFISRIISYCIKHQAPFFLYFLLVGFVVGWWSLAFIPKKPSFVVKHTVSSLELNTSTLLRELSPLKRSELAGALAGDFQLMWEFINRWDLDAEYLAVKGVAGVRRLSEDSFVQARILGHLLKTSSKETLAHLNAKMNVDKIVDEANHLGPIRGHFRRFLPQTYTAATFLLAIASPSEIISLPTGFRHVTQFYPEQLLEQIPSTSDGLFGERLFLEGPDVAFIAPYSHPLSLDMLRAQKIPLLSLGNIDTIEEVTGALLKVGRVAHHILEAQLLAIFMEAGFLSLDNRMHALQGEIEYAPKPSKLLYLSYYQNFAIPSFKSLTGQLLVRALSHFPNLSGFVPDAGDRWAVPCSQEEILEMAPDALIIANTLPHFCAALEGTEAFQKGRIFFMDEMVQTSPTQFLVLAYFDLFQALAAIHSL